MYNKKYEEIGGEPATVIEGVGEIDLKDSFECGQAFRYELIREDEGYREYMTVTGDLIIRVGQRERGELCFFDMSEEEIDTALEYFRADTDFGAIREDILSRTDSDWLRVAADMSRGIVIFRQDPWETVFSFIVSQNNNIPRIRKIIRTLSLSYGENLALRRGLKKCPLNPENGAPCNEICEKCGACYSFPTAREVLSEPERMESAKCGFRFKYLVDSAEKTECGKVDLEDIKSHASYEYTLEHLKEILGVGDKVASCAALFGFGNLDAFPIDVWMKRAIDTYFDGRLDPKELGPYAGVAQQYIFHRIRNMGE